MLVGKAKPHLSFATFVGVCCLLFTASATFASVPGFKIKVPLKTPLPVESISKVRVIVSVATTAAVTFRITDPLGLVQTFAPLVSGSAASFRGFSAAPPGAVGSDAVGIFPMNMTALGGLPAGDPAEKKYVILFNLDSDLDVTCGTTMAADETWRVEVVAPSPEIVSVCAQSLDQRVTGSLCSGDMRTVPLTPSEPIATVTTLADVPMPTSMLGCRPGVDAVLVLDRSGSMSSPVLGGSTTPKINALHTSVNSFISVWNLLRSNETTGVPGAPALTVSPADNIGVVYFDSNANWLSELNAPVVSGVSSSINGLVPYASASADAQVNVPLVGPNSMTSIGGGLLKAANAFSPAPILNNGNRKVVLLMTDGLQNTDPMVQVVGSNVQTTIGGGAGSNLPNQPPLQIYTLAVGTSTAINPVILTQIATASGGFYMNTQTDAAILPTYFLELLQNFVKFSTVETLRMASATTSFATNYKDTIPVTTTTQSITFHVDFDPRSGPMTLTVQPPGGSTAIVQTSQTGTLILNRMLPLGGTGNSGGDWNITIRSTNDGTVPFNLIVLGDDVGLNSDLISIAADYSTTDRIKVVARVNELEKPILGIGTHPNEKIVVKLIGPGKSLGDLLSSSDASSTPPAAPDRISPVQAKLDNILKNNPNALQIGNLNEFTLLDNGNTASNGDAKAGDGVYTALIPPQIEGQYNLLFGVEGESQGVGRFSRMQLKTVNVRAIPATTTSTATAQRSGQGNALVITFTPLTAGGQHVGPGWANYIWFTSPRTKPVKPVDNMNGSYTATIPYSGNPPRVKIHFIREAVMLADDITADRLPVPLNNGNEVIPEVDISGIGPGGPGPGGAFKRWGLSLHAGISIPHGDFDTVFNPGPNFGIDLEYRVTPTFSLEGIYGFHRFNGATFGPVTIGDLNVHQFSFNGKVYGSSSPVRPFFNFGGGAYVFNPGSSTHGGLNVGGGMQFDVTPTIAVDAMYNFHNVFTSGSNTRFSALQGGVRFRF